MRLSLIAMMTFFVATALASGNAVAFSVDEATGTNADGSARYADPDEQPLLAPPGDVQTRRREESGVPSGFSFSTRSSPATSGPNRVWSTESNPWR
jgi:hypothetical protein